MTARIFNPVTNVLLKYLLIQAPPCTTKQTIPVFPKPLKRQTDLAVWQKLLSSGQAGSDPLDVGLQTYPNIGAVHG